MSPVMIRYSIALPVHENLLCAASFIFSFHFQPCCHSRKVSNQGGILVDQTGENYIQMSPLQLSNFFEVKKFIRSLHIVIMEQYAYSQKPRHFLGIASWN